MMFKKVYSPDSLRKKCEEGLSLYLVCISQFIDQTERQV